MTLQVIGAGFGRTGTLSLQVALEMLGFGPCYHMIKLFEHPEHAPLWEAAMRGEPVDWDTLFEGFQATVDWPGCTFYRELLQAYPDAKVLLTVRDPDKWYDSTLRTIYTARKATNNGSGLFGLTRFLLPKGVRAAMPISNHLVWERTFDGAFEDRTHAIEVFERHNAEVKRHVPADQLLVFEVGDGWTPLCEFLGVEVPQDTPFPRLNDTQSFQKMAQRRLMIARAASIGLTSVAGFAVTGLVAAKLRRRIEV